MKDKIAVHKIDIKIGDKTISLKPEQAKELKKILNDMFEENPAKIIHEYHWPYWWNWPVSVPSYPQWTITCGTESESNSWYIGSTYTTCGTVELCLNAA